jgi:hypothetical protein
MMMMIDARTRTVLEEIRDFNKPPSSGERQEGGRERK